jgi:hypothetical protein
MKMVLASAAAAEVGALFFNAQEACILRQISIDLGHNQAATAIQTDNACAHGIMNSSIKQRRSKAIDMRFYWQYFLPPILGLSLKHTINGESPSFPHLSTFEHHNVTVAPPV